MRIINVHHHHEPDDESVDSCDAFTFEFCKREREERDNQNDELVLCQLMQNEQRKNPHQTVIRLTSLRPLHFTAISTQELDIGVSRNANRIVT